MQNCVRIGVFATFLAGATMAHAEPQPLSVGDPAPKLAVKSFVKGKTVSEFEPGKNYVVEFWATWCGPCRTSIPHLTELQKKQPDVTFIGVSVWERDQSKVKPFVEEMGDKMAYRVAVDAVGDKEKANEGAMAKTWMTAAGQDGIPTAFIINKEGKVAWIGHPMSMDEPLEKITSGSWDLTAARAEHLKAMEDRTKIRKVQSKFVTALRSGDQKKIVAAVEEIANEVPSAELMFGPSKLTALIKLDEQDKALEYAQKLSKTELSKDSEGLNSLAWAIVDPDAKIKPSSKLIEFAVEIARRADELAGEKNGAIADTLAKAYFDAGNTGKAVETQERAVRLMKEAGQEDPGVKDRLEQYKKSAK
jgi:thiol-disulfide isomerase/thioredoxin